jgi:hypothetical protein
MPLVAVCYRTNLIMRQLAPLFAGSPARVRTDASGCRRFAGRPR